MVKVRKPEFIARQGRKPTGLLGRLVAHVMARETKAENDQTILLLKLNATDTVFEIGYGHGETLNRIAKIVKSGRADGVDFSKVMFRRAARRNRKWINSGRMHLTLGNSADLIVAQPEYTKVLAVHTIYFWDHPIVHLKMAFDITLPGGKFILAYRSSVDTEAVRAFPESVYRFPDVRQIEKDLASVGFELVTTITKYVGPRLIHWTAAKKPSNTLADGEDDES